LKRNITLDLTAEELARLDEWIAAGSNPEQPRAAALREILVMALESWRRSSEKSDRLAAADHAFAAHLRSKGFLPE
jgi:hypothetical protein